MAPKRSNREAPPPGTTPARTGDQQATDDQAALSAVLTAEYGVLAGALSTAWSASLTRTSLFLFSLSASGVALGFAAQTGVASATFRAFGLALLPVLLFLGVATFVRLVELQRESMVYITGMNRIRHHFVESAPASRRFFVLPVHDDGHALFRSPGTGMRRRPPRYLFPNLLAQTQGIVGVVAAAVAAALVGLAAAPFDDVAAWTLAALAFAATLIGLVTYWQRSLSELRGSIESISPTPPDEIGAPF
jgi:hypothetical protein